MSGRRTIVAWIACAAVLPQTARAGHPSRLEWGGETRVEAFQTTDVFPGGPRAADDGIRLDMRPAVQLRLGSGWKLKPWGRAVVERYGEWKARDLERWSAGLDLKRGPHRLRVYGGMTDAELYFPSSAGGAILDRRLTGIELRIGLSPLWQLETTLERESQDFDPAHDERDATRRSLRTGLERSLGEGRTLSLAHLYRRTDSVGDLYTYDHNALRGNAHWTLSGWDARLEAETALRNYRTPAVYDANFARQDDRWRASAEVGRRVLPAVRAAVFGEMRVNHSTRFGKTYRVGGAGLAVEMER